MSVKPGTVVPIFNDRWTFTIVVNGIEFVAYRPRKSDDSVNTKLLVTDSAAEAKILMRIFIERANSGRS